MADTKLTGLTALGAAPAGTDLLYVVDDPGGTPLSKSMTVQNVLDTAVIHSGLTFNATDELEILQVDGAAYMHEGASGADSSLFIGLGAGNNQGASHTGDDNIGIGVDALNLVTTGGQNVCIGALAGRKITTGGSNFCLGQAAGLALTVSTGNILIGPTAGGTLVGAGASRNIYIGSNAGVSATTGDDNVAIGASALPAAHTGSRNVALGSQALNDYNTSGNSYNVAVGYGAQAKTTNGYYNTVTGALALDANTTGFENIAIGVNAMGVSTTARQSIVIGTGAGTTIPAATTSRRNLLIGYGAQVANTANGAQININNVIFGTNCDDTGTPTASANIKGQIGIGEITPGAKLHVKQEETAGARPALELEQLDIDDTFINLVGTSAADGSRSISSDTTEDAAKFGAFRVEINGTTKWVRVYDDES